MGRLTFAFLFSQLDFVSVSATEQTDGVTAAENKKRGELIIRRDVYSFDRDKARGDYTNMSYSQRKSVQRLKGPLWTGPAASWG